MARSRPATSGAPRPARGHPVPLQPPRDRRHRRFPARPARHFRLRVPRRSDARAGRRPPAAGAGRRRASPSAITSAPTSSARPPCAGRGSTPGTRSPASTSTLWALALVLALRAVAFRLGAPPFARGARAVDAAPRPTGRSSSPRTRRRTGGPTCSAGTSSCRSCTRTRWCPALSLALAALVALDDARADGRTPRLSRPGRRPRRGRAVLQGVPRRAAAARARRWRSSSPARRDGCELAARRAAVRPRHGRARPRPGRRDGSRRARAVRPRADHPRDARPRPAIGGWRFALWVSFWIVASLGVRLLGLGEAVRSLRAAGPAVVLAVMALSGWPLGLAFDVSAPEVLPNQKFVNDAAYLVEQSGPLLWLFTAVALGRIASTRARRAAVRRGPRAPGPPSTLQYAVKKASDTPGPPPRRRWCARWTRSSACRGPGDVVMQRPGARYPPAPVVLAGRRVPYERFTPYLTQFALARGPPRAPRGGLPVLPHARAGTRRSRSRGRWTRGSSRSTAATACASTRPASSSRSSTRKARASSGSSTRTSAPRRRRPVEQHHLGVKGGEARQAGVAGLERARHGEGDQLARGVEHAHEGVRRLRERAVDRLRAEVAAVADERATALADADGSHLGQQLPERHHRGRGARVERVARAPPDRGRSCRSAFGAARRGGRRCRGARRGRARSPGRRSPPSSGPRARVDPPRRPGPRARAR